MIVTELLRSTRQRRLSSRTRVPGGGARPPVMRTRSLRALAVALVCMALAAAPGAAAASNPASPAAPAAPAPAASLSIGLTPDTLVADGSSTTVVAGQVLDAQGNPVAAGDSVIVTTSGGVIGTTVLTDISGNYSATLTSSTTVGDETITATDGAATASATLHEIEAPAAPAPAASLSIGLTPDTLVADGTSSTVVAGQVLDAQGNPVAAGDSVIVTTSGGVIGTTVLTDISGNYSATLTSSTTVGDETITATDGAATASATLHEIARLAPSTEAACGPVAPGYARCLSLLRTDIAARTRSQVTPASAPSGYGPVSLQSAYALTSAASSLGAGATVAVVDAYDQPNAESDLAAYRSQFGLPACTTANGCFRKVNQTGGTTYPSANSGWGLEISLDLDMVSAVCPKCNILLVEGTSNSFADLGAAVNEAVALGAVAVSNSYGGGESPGETSLDSLYYNHPGVAITASSGDNGYGVEYPAASRYVVAVGGTTLNTATNARGWTESAWSGAGSGCSAYESKPTWQTDSGCTKRTVADVSAVADPNTGVAVYDSYGYGGWLVVGGTSASSPIIASTYALAGTPVSGTYPGSYPYANRSSLYDVTSGSNGHCSGSYLCTAVTGYDGPTGLGTPSGIGSFAAPRPSVTSISPTLGPPAGGTTVTLTGVNFSGATAVAFGVIAASSFTVVSGTSISAVSPAGTGTVDITVTTPNGTSATDSADRFSYSDAPAITSASGTTFTVGSPGMFTVTTSGSPTPAISETGALPSGVTLTDNGDGTGTLAGTPAAGTAGSWPITISAANGVSPDASKSFTLGVTTPTFTLSGTVTAGGVPLVGAAVHAFDAVTNAYFATSVTIAGGAYSFSLPAGGTYKLFVQPGVAGYPSQWYGGPDFASATPISLTADTTGVTITLVGTFTLSGTVTAGGVPLVGAAVHAFDAVTNAYFATSVTIAGGAYSFSLPAGGTYKLFVQPGVAGYPSQWYGGPDFASATPISLTADTTGVTITLVGTFTLSGTVTAGGVPLVGAAVHAFDAVTNAYFATSVTIAGGAYSFSLPAGGTYKLFVQPGVAGYPSQWYGGPDFASATPISLTADTTGVTITLVGTFTLSGTVTAGGVPLVGAAVHAFDAVTNAYFATSVTIAGGAYSFSLPAGGTYKLFVQPGVAGYPSQWYGGPDFASATPISLTADTTGVTITLVAGP